MMSSEFNNSFMIMLSCAFELEVCGRFVGVSGFEVGGEDVEVDAYALALGEGDGYGKFGLGVGAVGVEFALGVDGIGLPDEGEKVGKNLGCTGVLQPKY